MSGEEMSQTQYQTIGDPRIDALLDGELVEDTQKLSRCIDRLNFIKTFTGSPIPNSSTHWLPHRVYFANILTLNSASIKRPISNKKSSTTYFGLTNLIYLTITLICCVLTTIVLPTNENTIQYPENYSVIQSDLWTCMSETDQLKESLVALLTRQQP